MQIIGIILILLVLGLFAWWLVWTKKQTGVQAVQTDGAQVFEILVKAVYSPNVIKAKLGQPIKIKFTRKESTECSRFVIFSDFKIRQELPENQTIEIELKPERAGVFSFTCEMGMYQGKLIIEN